MDLDHGTISGVDLLASGKTISETAVALDVSRADCERVVPVSCGSAGGVEYSRTGVVGRSHRPVASTVAESARVLAEEMKKGEPVACGRACMKACRLYGAEVPTGSTDVEEIAVTEKERSKEKTATGILCELRLSLTFCCS